MSSVKRTDRSVLGWLTLGLVSSVITLSVSSAAWALDLDQAIQQQNADASQIVKTLGRGKKPNSQEKEARWKHKKKKVYVFLFKKARKHKA